MTSELISDQAFDCALGSSGLRAPAAIAARNAARTAFSQLVFKVARRLMDALSIVSSTRTLQPEHFHDLAKVAALLSAPLAANAPPASRPGRDRGMLLMRGGNGGTVMSGSYFNPADGPDASSYSTSNEGSYSHSFPSAGPGADGIVRFALDASPAFPLTSGGGGARRKIASFRGGSSMSGSYFNPADGPDASSYSTSNEGSYSHSFPSAGPGADGIVRFALDASPAFPLTSGGGSSSSSGRGRLLASSSKKSTKWLSDDALSAIIRECKARSAASARVSESAKGLIRVIVEANSASVLAAVRRKAAAAAAAGTKPQTHKRPSATAAAITRETSKWVLQI